MKLDGKALSESVLSDLASQVEQLKSRGTIPTLAVILVGDNPASLAYIKQKQKAADRIGAVLIFSHQPATISKTDLQNLVEQYNNDPAIHGIIIQRPIPQEVGDVTTILNSIVPKKDIDGFLPDTLFDVPVAVAVDKLLQTTDIHPSKKIAVIGRGDTAGKPIAAYFKNHGYDVSVIHSQTPQPDHIIRNADIVISCVGKEHVITKEHIQPKVTLISVGIWRDAEGKLHGDYDEADIADVAAWYTPTPGGVGPVNVACLMQNLVQACTISIAPLRPDK